MTNIISIVIYSSKYAIQEIHSRIQHLHTILRSKFCHEDKHNLQIIIYAVGYRTQVVLYQEKHIEQYMVTYGVGYRTQVVLYQ